MDDFLAGAIIPLRDKKIARLREYLAEELADTDDYHEILAVLTGISTLQLVMLFNVTTYTRRSNA